MKIKLRKNKKMLISVTALIVICSLGIILFTPDKDIQTSVREREYIAQKGNITVGVETSGQINTLPNTHTFEENTVIDDVFVKVGSEVKKGDKLATISLENLDELIKLAKDELSDAKAALLQASSQKDVLIKQNDKNKQDGLSGIHQDFEAKLTQLRSEKAKILKSIKEYEETIKGLDKRISELSSQVKDVQKKIANLQSKINANILKIGELNEKLLKVDDGSSDRAFLNQKINDAQAELQKLNNQLGERLELAKNNQPTIENLENEISVKIGRIAELENLINQSTDDAEKEKFSTEIKSLKEEISAKKADIETLSYGKEISSFKNSIKSTEERLRNAQNDLLYVSNGSDEMNAIRLEITKLQNTNTALQQEIDAILQDPIVAELEKLKSQKDSQEEALKKEYSAHSLKLEEIERTEIQYEQKLKDQGADNGFSDYKVNEELKAINETISKANRNVGYATEKVDKLHALQNNPTLYAEMDGIVTSLGYKAGDVVTLGKPVCVIGKLSETTMTVPVSAADIGKITVGQKVNVYIDAFAEQKFTGTVKERLLVANDNGDYPVIITIDPTEQMILPGMKAFSTIILKEKKDILTISNKAILLEDGMQYVNIRNENGELVKTKVTTGFSDGRVSEVLEGLAENDVVVVKE